MKKRTILSIIASLLLVLSCDDVNELIPDYNKTIGLEKDTISLSWQQQSLQINVKTLTDFTVSSDCDWISVTKQFSDKESFIELSVDENPDTLDSRIGIVTLVADINDANAKLYVIQGYKNVIRLLTSQYTLTSEQQDITVQIKSNCHYEVTIPQDASDWISVKATKAMSESQTVLSVSKNESFFQRSASILFNNLSEGVQDTLTIVQDEGFRSLRILLRDNPDVSIFYNALVATHLADSLNRYIDESYPSPTYDSTYAALVETGQAAVEYETFWENHSNGQQQRVVWPDQRLFKYTVFVVSDSVLDREYGIKSLDDLEAMAKVVYDNPEHFDDSPELSTSPLYRLMSYHILPFGMYYNQLNYTENYIVDSYLNSGVRNIMDMEAYYETMQPYAIMRISTPYDSLSESPGKYIYINRKGTVSGGNLESEGVRIWKDYETPYIKDAKNGTYFFVGKLLLFDQKTKQALRTRKRILFSTLSPDIINSNARGRMNYQGWGAPPQNYAVYAFKNGFCRNISYSDETMYTVRYQEKIWSTYYYDETTLSGDYDITFRLPAVPESGSYEIRISGYTTSPYTEESNHNIVQFYTRQEGEDFVPCGDPVDMDKSLTDPSIGYVSDKDVSYKSYGYYDEENDQWVNVSEEEAKQEAINANDDLMREHGYMKAPDSFKVTSGYSLRDDSHCYRFIVSRRYMEEGRYYYLRIRQCNTGKSITLPLNFIEIVPKDVYQGYIREDKH